MDKIRPHLWFDTQAGEAAEFYASVFPGSHVLDVRTLPDTPSGDTDLVSFELLGQPFMAISAGPLFSFTPAVSFLVACATEQEVDALWQPLADGGRVLMPLDAYPFSRRYGWTEDRYGLSWQVMATHGDPGDQRITPTLMFSGDVAGKAEEAIGHYTRVFPESGVDAVVRYDRDEDPDGEGRLKHARFRLHGQTFAAMDGTRVDDAPFNEAISFLVSCDSQQEIDRYWERLSAVPEAEQCGWLKDRYGVSWQIVPSAMDDMLRTGTEEQVARVTEAFLQMKKFDVAELERAYRGQTRTGRGE
jgi:predicted 3-demethylubiquinone-9 3-methyltransferase (glyoxalase superfamily)